MGGGGVDGTDILAVDFQGVDAKGRGREMPPPVLVSAATTLDALAEGVPAWARTLVEQFWPGPLTLVCRQQTSLMWDLGETRGTVAVRMPLDPVAYRPYEDPDDFIREVRLNGRPTEIKLALPGGDGEGGRRNDLLVVFVVVVDDRSGSSPIRDHYADRIGQIDDVDARAA